ncbi:hypothetical protein SDC9_150730 [bioreactor metagenome]|uniref:Uncharacterized protein n=1 Tax=bioreactor metagenome TaxID=1076179 RepID=A0A645EQ70_9ZZZZ
MEMEQVATSTIEQFLLGIGAQFGKRKVHIDPVLFTKLAQHFRVIIRADRVPRHQSPFIQGKLLLLNDQIGVDFQLHPQPVTFGTGSVGRVERKQARFDLTDRKSAVWASIVFAEQKLFTADDINNGVSIGQMQRRFDRIEDARTDALLDDYPIHNNRDVMFFILFQFNIFGNIKQFPINADTDIALLFDVLEYFFVLPFFPFDDRRQYLQFRAFRKFKNLIHHLLGRLAADRCAIIRTNRVPHTCKKKAQEIIDFCDRTDCRTGIAVRRLLIDCNRRTQAIDAVHIRFVHLTQKLARIG